MTDQAASRGANGKPARHVTDGDPLNALPAGIEVMTLDGILPVEFLNPGDRVITRNSGTAVLRHIRSFTACVPTVSIRPGSLGHMRPDRVITLPAAQEVLVRDWRAETLFGARQALAPISRLVDGNFITLEGVQRMTLVELVFDGPQILYADGLELAAAAPVPA
ncbi:Hint domain-containing protein [Antarctobacter jejuensis]|uniref:Hint domain-containing protein n=1 Tax=Antarctobacter jejuensis TaxID=1439938 RepID=UPI003FD139B7